MVRYTASSTRRFVPCPSCGRPFCAGQGMARHLKAAHPATDEETEMFHDEPDHDEIRAEGEDARDEYRDEVDGIYRRFEQGERDAERAEVEEEERTSSVDLARLFPTTAVNVVLVAHRERGDLLNAWDVLAEAFGQRE